MTAAEPTRTFLAFRPRARVLQLLGDELIGSPRLAVFELVKNAYDADAGEVVVSLEFGSAHEPTIKVTDDGSGMSAEVISNIWLVPGNDHRQRQRAELRRTPRHGRLPLGEKGLGRFAVHKLGERISMVTRAEGHRECVVEIDWSDLVAKPYLDEARVEIIEREPEVFTDGRTGTAITIGALRQPTWSRGDVRRLQRQITSICSPFEEPSGFRAVLELPGHEDWIADLPDVSEILGRAIWKFAFRLEGGRFDWSYEFRRVPGLRLEPRSVSKKGDVLRLLPTEGRSDRRVTADEHTTDGIGPVRGEFYVYDRDREVMRHLADVQLLADYLDENGGIRVYRDGIRVYNYGEQGDDWLGLDLRRVNKPTRGISSNIIIGAVHLSLKDSTGLVEKTNREGFVDNAASAQLRRVVLSALAMLENDRSVDKDRIRKLTAKARNPEVARIEKPIEELRSTLRKKGLLTELEPYVQRIEQDYREMQETLLSAGMSGLNLALVFHEVERGVRMLHSAIQAGRDPAETARQARDLTRLLDGFAVLLRKDSKRVHTARHLVDQCRRLNFSRLRFHEVGLHCPLLDGDQPGFQATFNLHLVLAALNNLVDNAIYWLKVRWPDARDDGGTALRRLHIGVSNDLGGGPAIVVADNGPGFQGDPPEQLVRPFFTRRPEGMGLGLCYANLAMELNGGHLVFPDAGDVELPDGIDGAVVAMVFGKAA
ncbi:ATP-binding protein [Leptolyngbya sp. 15MV]|nr:ATP-binding protein [Leptolyngbya sp. 15MV]